MIKILSLLLLVSSCAHVSKPTKEKTPKISSTAVKVQPIPYVAGIAQPSNTEKVKLYTVTGLDIPNNHFDLPIIYNKDVEKWVNYFTGKGREWTVKYLNNSRNLSSQFADVLVEQDMPRDLIFLSMAESGFQNDIISKATAVGAWQFMSFTGKRFGLEINYFYDERRHPEKSAIAAAQYLKELYAMFKSWELAMAAYNAGEGKIARAISRYKTFDFWKLTKGRYLKPETKNYVPKIMALAIIGKNLEYYGFSSLEPVANIDTVEVIIPAKIDLIKLSELLELDYQVFRQMNPEFVRWHTPLEERTYSVQIPKNKLSQFNKLDLNLCAATEFQVSPYKKLEQASRSHKVPMELLQVLNNNWEKGQPVVLPFRKDHDHSDRMYVDLSFSKKKKNRYYQTSSKRTKSTKQIASSHTYTVKSGENLWNISKKLGVSFNKIKKLNPDYKSLQPGDEISLK